LLNQQFIASIADLEAGAVSFGRCEDAHAVANAFEYVLRERVSLSLLQRAEGRSGLVQTACEHGRVVGCEHSNTVVRPKYHLIDQYNREYVKFPRFIYEIDKCN
jgi:hypothetical protein